MALSSILFIVLDVSNVQTHTHSGSLIPLCLDPVSQRERERRRTYSRPSPWSQCDTHTRGAVLDYTLLISNSQGTSGRKEERIVKGKKRNSDDERFHSAFIHHSLSLSLFEIINKKTFLKMEIFNNIVFYSM